MGIATGILCSIPFDKLLSLSISLFSYGRMAKYDVPPKQQLCNKTLFHTGSLCRFFMWEARLWCINLSGSHGGLAWLSHCVQKIAELCQHEQYISPAAS